MMLPLKKLLDIGSKLFHDKWNQTHNITIILKPDNYINFVPKTYNYQQKQDRLLFSLLIKRSLLNGSNSLASLLY